MFSQESTSTEFLRIRLKHTLCILLLILGAFAADAQPVATWLETEHDFGVFREELKEVKCTMRVVNTGDEPLLITRVQPSCGCTTGDYPQQPIAPGDTAGIVITFNAVNRVGNFDKDIFVYTNAKPRRIVLKIYGRIIGSTETVRAHYPIEVGTVRIDRKTIPMEEIGVGYGATKYLHGYNASLDTMTVAFGNLPKHLQVTVLPSDTLAPGDTFTATVHYHADDPEQWGLVANTIDFSVTPLSRSATTTAENGTQIDVMAVIREDFSHLTPQQRERAPQASLDAQLVDFEILAPNEPVQRSFTITNTGKENLIIRRLFVPDNNIKATCSKSVIKPKKSAKVTVTVDTPTYPDKIIKTTLDIITNDPANPVQQMRVVGQILK